MKKRISFMLFLTVLWRGICQVVRAIGKAFGYEDKNTIGKVTWRIFAACCTLLFALFTLCCVYSFCYEFIYKEYIKPHTCYFMWDNTLIGNGIVFQTNLRTGIGRVYDQEKKEVVLEDVDWVVCPDDNDSLAVYARKGRRGYINRLTGQTVIPEDFTRAWIFSEGLAAVEKDGELVFIDRSGQVVIDKDFRVSHSHLGYAFRKGYCIMKDPETGFFGLIDRTGEWALEPAYDNIYRWEEGFWQVEKDGCQGLYTAGMTEMFPLTNTCITIDKGVIEVRQADHIARRYDLEGNVLVDFVIDEVCYLFYETGEFVNQTSTEEGEPEGPRPIYAVANLMMYRVSNGYRDDYYGLIDRDGKRITPPLYGSIEAIGQNLYICQPQGVIINDRGEVVE